MLRLIAPAAAIACFALCTGGIENVAEQVTGGSSGTSQGSSSGSGGSGASGEAPPAAVGARPVAENSGASGLIRQVAGGGGPPPGIKSGQCGDLTDGGPVSGPDCVTAEIKCGETVVGHTRGGVNMYNTRFYERNTCWPGTRNHNAGDERVYMFVPDKSPRFLAGEDRQRVSVYFDSPCADLTFTKMVGRLNKCPRDSAKLCDSANPFTRKMNRNSMNITVDRGEVYYFLVEGADDENGAFSISLECGT